MPPKLKYKTIKKFFIDNGCKLLSIEYETNKKKLEYMCKCGHKRISCFDSVKRFKQFYCINCKKNKWASISSKNMHPKTLNKMIKVISIRPCGRL